MPPFAVPTHAFVSPYRALSSYFCRRRSGAAAVSAPNSFSPLPTFVRLVVAARDTTNSVALTKRTAPTLLRASGHESDVVAKIANLPPPHPRYSLDANDVDGAGYQRRLPLSCVVRGAFIILEILLLSIYRTSMRRIFMIRCQAAARSDRLPTESHMVLDG